MTREEAERVKSFSTLPERTKRHIKRQLISSAATGIIFAVAAIVYICLGAILNLWHPAWVIFIAAVILSIIFDIIKEAIKNSRKK